MEGGFKKFMIGALMRGSRALGPWLLKTVAYGITAGYFLFRPRRVGASMELYRGVFPGKRTWFYLWCAWRQFADFTATFCDRFALETGQEIIAVQEGWDHLEERIRAGKGGILIVAHMGSLEIAARLFQKKGLKMMLFAGERDPRQVARRQVDDMAAAGVRVQVSSQVNAAPFSGLDALQFLGEGGFVAVAGDLSWTDSRRRVRARLFGRDALLPGAPHHLALLTGEPVFTFFPIRTGPGSYCYRISGPRTVTAASRSERPEAVRRSVQAYAEELESTVRDHPWQWHIFEPILESAETRPPPDSRLDVSSAERYTKHRPR